MNIKKTVLDNGVTVISEQMDGASSAALGFWVRVGSRDEDKSAAGMSHFMEHMLFKGTPSRSVQEIAAAFDSIGAELNAFTSKECTCFYSRMINTHFRDAFEILADMLVNASLAQEAINTEKEVVLEEIARSEDTPDDYVFDVFSHAIFPQDTLGRPILGEKSVISSVKSADMHAFHNTFYTSSNVTVVACGAVNHEETVALAAKYLAKLTNGSNLLRPKSDNPSRELLQTCVKDTEQAHIVIGMPAFDATDSRRFAAQIFSCALGGGMSSRLFTEIREKRGLVYAVYSSMQLYENAGMFFTYAGTRPDNIAEVLEVTKNEFKKTISKPVEAEEFVRAKEYLCGHLALSMESPNNHMNRLGRLATRNMDLTSVEEMLNAYRAVNETEMLDIAEYLFLQEPTIAIVSPCDEKQVKEMI